MLPEVRAEGKGVSVRMGPKEAGAQKCGPTDRNRIVRLSLRASWHDTTKPTGSGDRVNAAVVHRKFTFLSGEICLPARQEQGVSAIIRSPEAPWMATYRGRRQKSAEGIVGHVTEGPNVEVSGGLR
jgi:hypothetical protein